MIEIRSVNKRFGDFVALDDVSLQVARGELLVLLGGSGSGKTTTLKMINRLVEPTSGAMEMNGRAVSFSSPRDASEHGIATVHQFGGTFPLMSIGRSFFVGAELTKRWGPFTIFDRQMRRVEAGNTFFSMSRLTTWIKRLERKMVPSWPHGLSTRIGGTARRRPYSR
jgi:ABC-type sugar transport system ATPase subunit